MQENDYEEQDKTLPRGEMVVILVTQAADPHNLYE